MCLAGMVAAIKITSLLGMSMLRSAFVTSVCRLTMLHAPAQMQIKNAKAFRALLVVADENGNHLHVSSALFPVPWLLSTNVLALRGSSGCLIPIPQSQAFFVALLRRLWCNLRGFQEACTTRMALFGSHQE